MRTDGQTDGQMDMKKPIGALCDCANAPKNASCLRVKNDEGIGWYSFVLGVIRFSE